VLVVTGWRLVNIGHVRELFHHHGVLPAVIWAATLIEVVPDLHRLRLGVDREEAHDRSALSLSGTATFVQLPKLSEALDRVPTGKPVTVHMSELAAVDHSCAELFREWLVRRRAGGGSVTVIGAEGRLARIAT